MATPAPIYSGGDRFEIAETRVNVPPEMQCLQYGGCGTFGLRVPLSGVPTSAAVLLQRPEPAL